MIREVFNSARRLGLRARSVFILLTFQLGGTVMELLGLATIVPVFQFLQLDGDLSALASSYDAWALLIEFYRFFGLDVSLVLLLAMTMVSLILRQVFVYVRLVHQARLRERLLASIRANGFSYYLGADLTYQESDDAGHIVNDLTTDLNRAVENVFSGVVLIGYGTIFTAYVSVLSFISGPLTFLALGIFGAVAFVIRRLMFESGVVGAQVTEANRSMSSFLVERLKLSRLIRLAGTKELEANRMSTLTEKQRDRNVRIFTLLATLEIIIEPFVVGGALIFVYVSIDWFDLAIETVGLFLLLVVRLLPVVKEVARVHQSRKGTRASFDVVLLRLSEMEAAREDVETGEYFEGIQNMLVFRDVCFSYDRAGAGVFDRGALHNVSFELLAGQLMALVGPSGAGKSTLVDLIPRLRRPQAGSIEVDGKDIRAFSLSSLRRGISYAPQSPQIFNVPLSEHIRYGRPEATMDEVRRAAELANAAAFIEQMPQGYESLAGDGGSRLSGGQRQRLDLARALVSNASLLILDEPTSALDAESEALFREALEQIRREAQVTIIVIAHRLSTVSLADKIVVLDSGSVIAEGSHDDLTSSTGWYRDAFLSQHGSSLKVSALG